MSDQDALLQRFAGKSCLNMESYRRDGRAVKTPLWFAVHGNMVYIRTYRSSAKARRITRNPSVMVVPCNYAGKPDGEWIKASARVATPEEKKQVIRLLDRRYSVMKWMMDLFSKIGGKKYEIYALQLGSGSSKQAD